MSRHSLSGNSVKLYQAIFGLAFLAVCIRTVKGLMYGRMTNAKMTAAISLAVGLVLMLDKYYWIMAPVCWIMKIKIPGLPFDSWELGCLAVAAVHFIRVGLRREHAVRMNGRLLVTLPLLFWICLVWVLRPTGVNMLGSGSIGGRFYIKVACGYLAMFALSTVRLTHRDCKILFYTLLAAATFGVLSSFSLKGLAPLDDDSGVDAATRYKFLCFLPLYEILFIRYSLREVIHVWWTFLSALILGFFVVYSGKRSATATLVFIPYYRALLTRKQLGTAVVASIVGVFVLFMGVGLDGTFYQVPRSMARGLAIVVPKYKRRYRLEGVQDTFRDHMRMEARAAIRKNPWIGRGGFRMDHGETVWTNSRNSAFGGHALAGAWHSAVYAYPADFGIPALLFWLLFNIYALVFVTKLGWRVRDGTHQAACVYYYGFLLFHAATFAYTSGHASMSTMQLCFEYGMVLALANGVEDEESQRLLEMEQESAPHA